MTFTYILSCIHFYAHALRTNLVLNEPDDTHLDPEKYDAPHDEHLTLEKHDAQHFRSKTLQSLFKIGRHGSDKCLSFLHIPKNGGTSVEQQSQGLQHVVKATDPSARHWGMFDSSLNCTNHSAPNKWPSCSWEWKRSSETTKIYSCSVWHVPPYMDSKLAASYTSDGCQTFCVVRNPEKRFVSGIRHWYNKCQASEFQKRTENTIRKLSDNPFHEDCHFFPQTGYIYGDSDSPQFCSHQIRWENLTEDFNNLMRNFDIPMKLEHHEMRRGHCSPETESQYEKIVHNFTVDYYYKDFKNFEYKRFEDS